MQSIRVRSIVILAALILFPALAGAAELVRELPTLGGKHAQAEDINDNGQIVGWSQLASGRVEATVWNAEAPSSLGLPGAAPFSFATAINNVGEVAGYSETGTTPGQSGNPRSAAFWGASGTVDIGAAMGFTESIANDINDYGVVALQGNHPGPFGSTAGYVWNEMFGGAPAGADPIYKFGGNNGVNNLNDVVGFGSAGFDGQQAILAEFNGAGWNVGSEIGPQAVRTPAIVNAISDGGILVGQAGDDVVHFSEAAIFTLDKFNPVEWLGTLDEFEFSNALDLNEVGLAVGYAVRYVGDTPELRAVVWSDGEVYDLNHLLKQQSSFHILIRATGVNEQGDVVGYGALDSGEMRPFVIRQLGQGPTSHLFSRPGKPAELN